MNSHVSSLELRLEPPPVRARQRIRAPWPSVGALLALRRTRWINVGRRCRIYWFALRSINWRLLVDDVVTQCPPIGIALKKHPILFRPLVSSFLNANFTLQDRCHAFAHDLAFTATRINQSYPEFLRGSSRQALWFDGSYTIELALNLTSPQEGLWCVALKDSSGHCVFLACFSVLAGPVMFIGAIQGGTACASMDPRAAVRAATKYFAGLRPQALLLQVLRCIASAWRVRSIVGVSNKHQVTLRSQRRSRATVTFCYDGYFVEAGAQPSLCGNWRVPLDHPQRATETIASRKRSMYRRRYSQIQQLESQIASHLGVESPARSDAHEYPGSVGRASLNPGNSTGNGN